MIYFFLFFTGLKNMVRIVDNINTLYIIKIDSVHNLFFTEDNIIMTSKEYIESL